MRHYAFLCFGLGIACLACGSPGSTANEPPRGPEAVVELICGHDLPDRCAETATACRVDVEEIFPSCIAALAPQLPPNPTEEQRSRLAGLAVLCTTQVHTERRALQGHTCGGPELDAPIASACLLCSVAAGTVRVGHGAGRGRSADRGARGLRHAGVRSVGRR